jgi:ubiquinone/menaquinone biosynthesis C-methylase UbiE
MAKRSFDDFDEYASGYRSLHDKNVRHTGANSEYFSMHKAQLVAQELNDIHHLLDFGCGDGTTSAQLQRLIKGATIYGIDISKQSIETAAGRHSNSILFSTFNGRTIPFSDNFFDAVFVANVFHHIAFDLHVLLMKEIHRVLKKGGTLYFFEHNPLNPATRYLVKTCPFDKDAKLLPHRYAAKLISQQGFREIKRKFILFFPRNGIWKKLHCFEKNMAGFPLGAQYYFRAVK